MSFTSSTGGTTEFVYDVTAGIPAVIEETGPVYYVREPNGALIVRLDGEFTNYYHFDALGSTRLLTNSSGAVTDEYTYDAWGMLTNHTEHTGSVDQPYQYVGRLGYYTHYQDANLALLQLGFRLYDVSTGRFTQRDPIYAWIGTGMAQYQAYMYASGSPTRRIDASGLYATEGDCKNECPNLEKYVGEVIRAMEKGECAAAIAGVQCRWFMDRLRPPHFNPLQGITVECMALPDNISGKCRGADWIVIDCKKTGDNAPRSIIHELTHACAFAAGETPEQTSPFECNRCPRRWGKADPVWEQNAEDVAHACFPSMP